MTSAMLVLEQSVMVFPQNYLSMCWVNIKRAIVLLVKNQAEILHLSVKDGWKIHSQDCSRNKPLTLDHVILRSPGDSYTWNNVVIICKKCNPYKGNSAPRMHLRNQPKLPVQPAISVADEFWINMQANLE